MRKILIADDENIERKGLRCLVETIGGEFEIREAKNGREALAEAKKMQPDIVLTDIKMPFMDGVELAEKISDIRPDTVTILVSGYSDFEYARRGLQCGVRDYILKPVDPEEFTEVFLKAVDEVEQKKETGMQMQKNHEFLEEYFLLQFLYKGAKEIQREAAGLLDVSWWEKVRRVVILETLDSFFDEYDEEFRGKLAEELKLPFFYLNIDINRSVLLFTDNVKVDYPVLGNHIHSFTRQTFRQDVYVAISEQLESGMDMPEAYRRAEGLMENRFYRREEWVFTDEGGVTLIFQKNSPSCLTQWKKTSVFGILRICGNIFMRLPEADRWAAYIPRYLQNFPAQKSLTFYIRICAVLRKSATRLLKKYISAG